MTRPLALAALCLALAVGSARADSDEDLLTQSQAAARGVFDLCRADAPDAARVAEHGEVWGWPPFVGWLEHPEGYTREAGGESRRDFQFEDKSAYVEATIQSGEVTSASPAQVRYFRCNIASDQPVGADLAVYFTGLYGAPAAKSEAATVWLGGAAAGHDAGGDAAALQAVLAAGVGAQGVRVELTRERGLDRAKLTMYVDGPVS